jgi:hypothetical protein
MDEINDYYAGLVEMEKIAYLLIKIPNINVLAK